MKEHEKKVWMTEDCDAIEYREEDGLHLIHICRGERLIDILCTDREDALDCIRRLDAGDCPIADGWEDGLGHSIADIAAGVHDGEEWVSRGRPV